MKGSVIDGNISSNLYSTKGASVICSIDSTILIMKYLQDLYICRQYPLDFKFSIIQQVIQSYRQQKALFTKISSVDRFFILLSSVDSTLQFQLQYLYNAISSLFIMLSSVDNIRYRAIFSRKHSVQCYIQQIALFTKQSSVDVIALFSLDSTLYIAVFSRQHSFSVIFSRQYSFKVLPSAVYRILYSTIFRK